MDISEVDDDDAVIDNSPKCSLCDFSNSIDQLFDCSVCSSPNEQSYLCDVCVLSHVHRGHRVVDDKGYAISQCGSHRLINDMFCTKCQVVICSKCLPIHLDHKCVTIKDKCVQSKKLIFDFIDKFDKISKDVSFRRLVLSDSKNLKKEFLAVTVQESTANLLVDTVTYIREVLLSDPSYIHQQEQIALKENEVYKTLCVEVDKYEKLAKASDKSIIDLREVLKKSEGDLVESVSEMGEKLRILLGKLNGSLEEHVCFKPFNVGGENFHKFSKQLVNEFLKKISCPEVLHLPFKNIELEKSELYPDQKYESAICHLEGGYCGMLKPTETQLLFSFAVSYTNRRNCQFCYKPPSNHRFEFMISTTIL